MRGWGKNVVRSARFNVPDGQSTFTTTPDNYRKLRDNIKEGYRSEGTSYGKKIYRIGFNFPIQGVMIHYGAGRGQGGQKGSTWKTPGGAMKSTKPASLGKAGSGNRRPNNWFNKEIHEQLPELEKVVEELFDGAVLNATNIFIKDGKTD